MRKRLTVMVVGLATLVFPAAAVYAQTSISLQASLNSLNFKGASSATQITMGLGNPCPSGASYTSDCLASGSGGASGTSGYYQLLGGGAITLTNVSGDNWTVSEGSVLDFCFSSGQACSGTVFLKGTMHLLTFTQNGNNGSFNVNLSNNLTLDSPAGSLGSYFTNPSVITLTVTGFGEIDLQSLLSQSSSDTLTGISVSSGLVDPTPEPGTIALFGSGLLGMAGFARRRLLKR